MNVLILTLDAFSPRISAGLRGSQVYFRFGKTAEIAKVSAAPLSFSTDFVTLEFLFRDLNDVRRTSEPYRFIVYRPYQVRMMKFFVEGQDKLCRKCLSIRCRSFYDDIPRLDRSIQ